MPKLSTYVLKQLLGPVALFAFLMTAVIWLTQALSLLDKVINRGQSATTFAYLTLLVIPSLLIIILPLAFFFGGLYALSRLQSDSELVVMASAGFSRAQMTVPVLVAAGIIMVATYACGLYLMPAGQRAMNDKLFDIRANIGASLLNEGTFNTQTKGLTVFIREIDDHGGIYGVLVHDNRNPKAPVTYLAESGQLLQTPAGARLLMQNGTIQWARKNGARLEVAKFESYPFDLDQFVNKNQAIERKTSELYLNELLSPDPKLKPKTRKAYIAEAHNRLSVPLYCIPFALIALAAVVRGSRARGAHVLRLTAACFAAVGLRIAGYGVQGMVASNNSLVFLFYVLPLLGSVAAILLLRGLHPKPALAAEAA
ncbi:lipopolysaccharide export system permease protein [Rhizomicrobium palustre]|uniref:Lipopolysaccharide export system permease protein n=1 Tax=Rhizomicrobium palustre TaxID=189966 RepID=A0A846MVD0_9PROT|nr:LPS export ABC transporter permease LptF [Rhizomicrobium palustre]NIK87020.1 lipopolysaccharide export system permease protein [Rhizomicrobium palustre]